MLISILILTFFVVLLLALVACETYAMSYPQDKFSKWWRANIMELENNNNE